MLRSYWQTHDYGHKTSQAQQAAEHSTKYKTRNLCRARPPAATHRMPRCCLSAAARLHSCHNTPPAASSAAPFTCAMGRMTSRIFWPSHNAVPPPHIRVPSATPNHCQAAAARAVRRPRYYLPAAAPPQSGANNKLLPAAPLPPTCVMGGMTSRIFWPSLLGLMPMSDSFSAFSMSLMLPLSKGVMVSVLASGTAMEARLLMGVSAP